MSRDTSSRAIEALPSGKWKVKLPCRNDSSSGRPSPSKPMRPARAASSAGVVSTRLLLRPPWPRKNGSASGLIFGVRQQELLVADAREQRQLLLDGLAVQVVGVLAVEPGQVAPGGLAERRLGEELGPRRPAGAGHQAVLAEVFLVEEGPGAELVLLEQRRGSGTRRCAARRRPGRRAAAWPCSCRDRAWPRSSCRRRPGRCGRSWTNSLRLAWPPKSSWLSRISTRWLGSAWCQK